MRPLLRWLRPLLLLILGLAALPLLPESYNELAYTGEPDADDRASLRSESSGLHFAR